MREASHESNRICQEHMLTFVEVEASGSWIQCGEQFIFREGYGSGQFIEQRGFPCVSITDYGYSRYRFSQAFSPLHLAMLDNLLELPLDYGDAIVDQSTVGLLRKLLLKKAKMLNVQTAVWFKKAKISNFNFQKRRKFFSYHPREGF